MAWGRKGMNGYILAAIIALVVILAWLFVLRPIASRLIAWVGGAFG